MSRTNIQIPPVLQYHTPKMCFPSLPIQSFMETVARIIPVWFFFPPGGLSFPCGRGQLEKLASGSQKGVWGTTGNVSGARRESSGFAPALCFHTPQLHSLQLKCHHCATPPVCMVGAVVSHSHTLPYPVIWYSVPLPLIASRPV